MVKALEDIIAKSSSIVFFGGAGVSTESGIPDFRSVDGLYHQKYDYPPETILSHTFWEENPEEFYRFYRDKLIVPGFIDTHLHFPQTEMIASPAPGLLPWLETYTFPTEARFADVEYAKIVYQRLAKELIRRGTTRICAFSSVHRGASEASTHSMSAAAGRRAVGTGDLPRKVAASRSNEIFAGSYDPPEHLWLSVHFKPTETFWIRRSS